MKGKIFKLFLVFIAVFALRGAWGQDVSYIISNVTCNGLTNGSIQITLISQENCGSGPYQYQIVGPPPSNTTFTSSFVSQTSYTFTGLGAGNYSIYIYININGSPIVCTQALSIPVIEPNPLVISSVLTQPKCAQVNAIGNNYLGSAVLTVSGGSPGGCSNPCRGYNISWTGPSGISGGSTSNCPREIVTCASTPSALNPNTYTMNNLVPGTYTVTARDNNGCQTTTTFTY